MAEAESRHASAAITISQLERKTAEHELENAKTIEENKRLLHRLEELNSDMTLSEHKVKELQEDLDAAHVCPSAHTTPHYALFLKRKKNEKKKRKHYLTTYLWCVRLCVCVRASACVLFF